MRNSLRAFVASKFLLNGSPEDLADDTSFLETGIIDSMGVVELLTFLEEEFGVKVLDEEIVPENLDSINNLCCFLEKKSAPTSRA